MEILPAEGSQLGTKGYYRMHFSLAFQYVLLALDGFDALYDGTNEAVRRAFAMFIFEKEYKAPNGRGYVVLRPAQDERRVFSTPLASLRDLGVSLLKPNGTLFNNSTDAYTASHLQYETGTRMFLKVVVDQYFDRNELYVGDSVMFRNFRIEARAGTSSPAHDHLAAMMEFVNRPQGHEIVQLGSGNEQGFVNAIYVLAPGVLDVGAGRVIVDDNLVGVVGALGAGPLDGAAPVVVTRAAAILNASLQPVLALRVGCLGGAVPGGQFLA
jgi:hypothetical protein